MFLFFLEYLLQKPRLLLRNTLLAAPKATSAAPKQCYGCSKGHICCSKTLFWLLRKVLQNGLGQSHHCDKQGLGLFLLHVDLL
uniref:Putative secreted protein n=1 Tax=Ixodes ricinus TaxID=34613 RepID=A0A6B0TX63_IXORI